ncbi:helix-turn-helix transcriptional regulator [Actinomadura miaoliensis]|uniref:Helix-turn-helix transcriptional regulator n=1 Tax=Actinomadura miaoliensis TaxID=430685 RepID=A0ABP7WYL4_9ACTN
MPARSEPYDSPAIVTFATELAAWRSAAGLTKKELADRLGYADSYVGQIELRKNTPSEEFAQALDTFFNTNGVFHRLWRRIKDSRHILTPPPGYPQFAERREEAICVKSYGALLINGLFQTKDYVRAIMGVMDAQTAEEYVARRLEEQAILAGDDPPQVFLTFDEFVLRRVIGSREIQRAQLQALLEVSERPNIMLDVVPLSAGYYPGLAGSFTVLGFDDGSLAAYTEAPGAGMLIEQPVRAAEYVVRYDLIRGYALPAEDSRTLIRAVMEEL